MLQRWVQHRLPGVLAGGCETLGQGGGFCLPRSSPEGLWLSFSPCSSTERVPADLAQPMWGGRSSGLSHPSKQQWWVPSLKPHSRNGEANLVVQGALQGGQLLPLHPPPEAGLRWVPEMGCRGDQRHVSGQEPRAAPAAALRSVE